MEKTAPSDPWRRKRLMERLPVRPLLNLTLGITGLKRRGRANACSPVLVENEVPLPGLPAAFHGYRILQLTDLHLDNDDTVLESTLGIIAGIEHDLCVFTGDYSARHDEALLMSAFEALRGHLEGEAIAVLGNHDSIRVVSCLEAHGIQVLLNERVTVTRGEERITLAGVDDYHYFRLANLERTLDGITPRETVILLNHSPEQFRQAGHAGVDLYLCGHTHGGQICLPGGLAPGFNIECTRRVGRGAWRYGAMHGYTSRGVGTSLVNVRYNCPPEITRHRLVGVEDN